jgi:hypothetical protein
MDAAQIILRFVDAQPDQPLAGHGAEPRHHAAGSADAVSTDPDRAKDGLNFASRLAAFAQNLSLAI